MVTHFQIRTEISPSLGVCCLYTRGPGLPVFPGCQLPSGYSRALSIVVTTYRCLVLDSNQNLRFPRLMLPLHQLSIYREKGVRSPVCLRVSLVPIYYHTIAVYSLPRETVMQGPRLSGDCYLETVLGTFTLRTARQN